MSAARTTRARKRSDQLSSTCPEASEAGRAFSQALDELAEDNAKQVVSFFLLLLLLPHNNSGMSC